MPRSASAEDIDHETFAWKFLAAANAAGYISPVDSVQLSKITRSMDQKMADR